MTDAAEAPAKPRRSRLLGALALGTVAYCVLGIAYNLRAFAAGAFPAHVLSYLAIGPLYLAIGAYVWWRRPGDGAARAMLLIGVTASLNLVSVAETDALGIWLNGVGLLVMPFFGPTGLYLGLAFVGRSGRRWRVVLGIFATFAALLGVALVAAHALRHHTAARWLWTPLFVTLGLELAVTAVGVGALCMHAAFARGTEPLQRRRARLLAAAVFCFVPPSITMLFLPGIAEGTSPYWVLHLLNICCLAAFPLLMAYAVVRHQLFDLRVVLRQGLVYGTLSLLVTLVYTLSIVGAYRVIGTTARSPEFLVAMLVVVTVFFGLLKLRIQGLVDRLVFRSRYVFARAISAASEALVRTRSIDVIVETVRHALLERMLLCRCAIALRGDDGNAFQLHHFGGGAEEPGAAERLPRLLAATEVEALVAPARTGDLAYGHDVTTAGRRLGLVRGYPLQLSGERGEHHLGWLLLGPKRSGRGFDRADDTLVRTLANQVAVALENAFAFAELSQLKDELEQQVQRRTKQLRDALEELQAAQSQLVESETQAMLTRFVAGIVHEINSPLGVIRSSGDTVRRALQRSQEIARRRQEDAGALRAIATGQQSSGTILDAEGRIRELLAALQHFVSLDEAESKTVDLRQGVEQALQLLAPQLQRIEVKRQLSDEPVRVCCFPARLNRVVLGLLQNAASAVGERGRITVTLQQRGGSAELSISDDGRGIPADQLREIFSFGFTRKAGRIGLRVGLPLAKRVVEQLGGAIAIDSEPGRGTTVRLTLPLLPPTGQRES